MTNRINSVCIYGIGGIGGYFGCRIASKNNEKKKANQVYFIARGNHLEAIQQHGLTMITDQEEYHCFPNIATDDVRHIPNPDLYLLCIKGYDLNDAVQSITRKVSNQTIVIPLLNGVDIYERIRSILKKGIVIPAAVYISSSIENPGIIRQKGPEGHIVLGKDPDYLNYDYQHVLEFFKEMGISHAWYSNPYSAIWAKYIFIAPFSLITAYAGKTIGEVLADEKLRNMTKHMMEEVIFIAKAKKIDVEEDIIEKTLQKSQGFPYETKTSFQRDYEKDKNRHEGDLFGGALVRMAREYNISIPTIMEVYRNLTEDIS